MKSELEALGGGPAARGGGKSEMTSSTTNGNDRQLTFSLFRLSPHHHTSNALSESVIRRVPVDLHVSLLIITIGPL